MELLQTFLEGNPYGNTEMAKRESYFKNNIYIVLRALVFLPRAEKRRVEYNNIDSWEIPR